MSAQDSIYDLEPSEDYPSEDAQDVLEECRLYEEFYVDVAPKQRTTEALDERLAKCSYAFATRQEKYELYRRFREVLEPEPHKGTRKQ